MTEQRLSDEFLAAMVGREEEFLAAAQRMLRILDEHIMRSGVRPSAEMLEVAARNAQRPPIDPHARELIQKLARGIGGPQ